VLKRIEQGWMHNALTQRHTDLKNEFYDKVRARGGTPNSACANRSVASRSYGLPTRRRSPDSRAMSRPSSAPCTKRLSRTVSCKAPRQRPDVHSLVVVSLPC
jgi:hypothetical protein